MPKTTFIILSASFVIRKGLSSIINLMDHTLIYDELESIEELDISSPYHVPDFLLIDLGLVNERNISLLTDYKKKYPIEILGIVTGSSDNPSLKCKSYLYLYDNEEDIKNKLLVSIQGEGNNGLENKKINTISDREKDVLQLVAKGMTNKEIADTLFISLHTVITHRKNITKKLGIKTVSGLTVYAILNNIIELKDVEQ